MVLTNPGTALMKCAIAAGLYRQDGNAFAEVQQTIRHREQQLRESEAGKRVETIKLRQRSTADQLAAAKQEAEQAEAAHFAALGGDSQAAIESARTAVLACQGNVQLLQGEVDSLKQIAVDARAAFGSVIDQTQPIVHRDIADAAVAKQQAAVDAILAAFEQLGLWPHFKAMAEAAEVLDIVGTDSHAFRIACTDNGLSEMFGRKMQRGHVSLQAEEFRSMTPDQLAGVLVRGI